MKHLQYTSETLETYTFATHTFSATRAGGGRTGVVEVALRNESGQVGGVVEASTAAVRWPQWAGYVTGGSKRAGGSERCRRGARRTGGGWALIGVITFGV